MSSVRQPERAVVDINLFVSGLISRRGQPNQLIAFLRRDSFVLVISEQLRSELGEVLQRERFAVKSGLTEEEREDFLLLVDSKAVFVTPRRRLPVIVTAVPV